MQTGHTLSAITRRGLLFSAVLVCLCAASNAQSDGPEGSLNPAVGAPGAQRRVTVAELTELVQAQKGKRDGDAAKEIEVLQLTERLSSPKLAALSSELPGGKSRNALMAVGDASVFLEPPQAEIPSRARPDLAEQRQIMLRAVGYLKSINPKLPDFYAKRFTAAFEEVWAPKDRKGTRREGTLHFTGTHTAMVNYRRGKEIVHERGTPEKGLVTRGTFGPILNTAILDAARSGTTQWSRWEMGPNGPMAVFRFQTLQSESHYHLSSTGLFGAMAMDATAYHGEIGIDPGSGTILRLVLQADPPLGSSIDRADIMVEYGPVAIGGKLYTCPLRSVSFSEGALEVPTAWDTGSGWKRETARLNDVVFSDYHVFRTEMRIVPD